MVEKLRVRYPDFAARVKHGMKGGITRKHIAVKLKVGVEMARRYEEGRAKPRHDKMRDLAELLGYPSAAALEYGTKGADATPASVSPAAMDLARAFDKLSPALQSSIRNMVFTIASAQSVARWLIIEPPKGDGYVAWERAVERAYEAEMKQAKLDFNR